MKGLELAERYFEVCALPIIRDKFGTDADRIAAGLVGPGSECFGYDDLISRDHDWGPGFCLWLTKNDYDRIGRALQEAYSKLPQTFEGFGPRNTSPGEEGRVGICEVSAFYRRYTGLDRLPRNVQEWLHIPEQLLAVCTNGKVFYDPLGEFSRWRSGLLAFYPEDIRILKIASRCMTIAQSGQYNLERAAKRNDLFAARYAESQFCADVISFVFLLNRRYCPFYKWMHRAVRELPVLGKTIHSKLSDLLRSTDYKQKIELIESTCALLIRELEQEGLSNLTSDFLLDHGPVVHSKIRDNTLRKNFVPNV